MMITLDVEQYQRILGDELLLLRKKRRLTREQLIERLKVDISRQTIATYEQGTRQCTLVRFVELCLALDELPHQLIARVHARMFPEPDDGRITIDLRRVVQDKHAELQPLRRWAKDRLKHHPAAHQAVVGLDFVAIERMAELCGITTVDLISHLQRINEGNP